MHKNARLTPKDREVLIQRLRAGQRVAEVVQTMGLSETTVRKWWRRFRQGESLADRSSAPITARALWPTTMAEDERKESAVAFLEQVVEHYRSCGIRVERVMTDNGSAYRSRAFADACRRLQLRHLYT